ncbi:MAG: DUF6468 domain-containing protein [Alphaproteobacteria bacterium]
MLSLDIAIILLLAVGIGYAFVLDRRLARLRNDRDLLQRLLGDFQRTTQTAERAIAGLKTASTADQRSWEEETARIRAMREDLDVMIQRGESVAHRLESTGRTPSLMPGAPVAPVSEASARRPAAAAAGSPTTGISPAIAQRYTAAPRPTSDRRPAGRAVGARARAVT